MKCPACKKRLRLINPVQRGEYVCDNEQCPANKEDRGCYAEFYGVSQEEIDKQWD